MVRRIRYGRPVVVVSGLPRSGTSMMMQMLRAGGLEVVTDALRSPDESNPKGYYELEAVKELDKGAPPAWLPGARGKAVKVISSLVGWLPDTCSYDVIFMQRDLDEVIVSQDRMLADRGESAGATDPARLRELYRKHVADTLRLLAGRPGVSTLIVDYGEALARPSDTAVRINKFLGGGLDVARMASAADPALHRNRRQP
jgi:hypothetical protein